ncbi:hypothetical protein [Arcanobacterium hippocoleae]|uniref:EC042-2821-like Restriction Endonuclease-like domain-containing protein n=1 Tax=Arcanobacterium hippocoleae TaxID=149017 RepID=A0ABU1T3A8_9ACTO|nr:hypothetical protein [Arcanobacterium hippocoleae]MDR6939793.1 hypothetical protein [Arcanobacterium hippocoleae]
MPENYLNLSVTRTDIDGDLVRAKYPPEVAQRMLEKYNEIAFDVDDGNERYASYYRTELVVVKNPKKADLAVRHTPEAQAGLAIAKQLIDPREKYIYTYKRACEAINKRAKRDGIIFRYRGAAKEKFTTHDFNLFVSQYDMKNNEQYAFNRAVGQEHPSYTYSQQAIDFVVDSLRRDADVLDRLKAAAGKRK